MNAEKELMGASTGLLVLSVLAGQASYGYQVVKRINAESQGLFTWREGTIYPVLHRLEKDGLIRSEWRESAAGRKRKYYHVTAKGRKSLASAASQWHAFHELVSRLTGATHGKPKPALA